MSELFLTVNEEILDIKKQITLEVARKLNLITNEAIDDKVLSHLELKLQSLFQEYSLKIFHFSDQQI